MVPLKIHDSPTLDLYSAETETTLELPFVDTGISAGFPSPAMDFEGLGIDLNRDLIQHPAATFFARVKGDSLKNAGIQDGDLLIIDRSLEPRNGKIAVCYLDGEFTAKRLKISGKEIWLVAENEAYPPIRVQESQELMIWGIVTHVIKRV